MKKHRPKNIMRTIIKKLAATVLIVAVLVGSILPASAMEEPDKSSPLPAHYYESKKTDPESPSSKPASNETTSNGGDSKTSFNSPSGLHHHYYGDQLTTSQEKQLYSAIERQLLNSGKTQTTHITFDEPIELSYSININHTKTIEAQAIVHLQRALDAFRYDHPQFYWITGNSTVTNVSIRENTNGIISIIGASAIFEAAGIGQNDAATIINVVDTIVSQAKAYSTAYQQVNAVHTLLAQHISYSKSSPLPYRAFQITGGFVDGSGVCETYAKTFKLICDRLGYKTVLVVGTSINNGRQIPHMWNYVKLDGAWYAVDLTWNDQAVLLNDYFLVGRNTSAPNFGGGSFASSHVEEYTFNHISYTDFSYPQISTSRHGG